ncbi:hypothetical protein [Roseisolibacter sp. H3M3-2]|uniref:hypothetical protein n=1 Tax=Roseisolibacter sp. H3M3-2 TaxID=3031323 RepID=UPI0023DA4C6D|nr:hypothetical protein [Roseisolibacter sp. H3M3-2]MDF1501402.1 hypothetical protein [Roseisolibacter sp. H3M3-2]
MPRSPARRALVGAVLLAACASDLPTALAPGAAPSRRTEHAPAGPGAQISRGGGQFVVSVRVPDAPYFVVIGASASAARDFCSGGDPEFGPSRDLFAEGPNGIHAVFRSDGKVPLLLYPAGTEDLCSGTPVAEGTGLYTEVSSNIVGGHGRGTDGFRVRGQVTEAGGAVRHVLVVVQRQLRPDGLATLVAKVEVR